MAGEDKASSSPTSPGRVVPSLIAWAAIVLLLGMLASCANYFVRADLLLSRVDRYITDKSGGLDGHFDLVPAVFVPGQSLAKAEAELLAAGYRRHLDDIFVQEGEYLPDAPIVYGKDGGSGLIRLICSVDFLVILNSGDTIETATAHVQSACL